jgi:hypothetical protein
MGDIVKKSQVQLVPIEIAGLLSLRTQLCPGCTGHGGDWSSFKIEGVEVHQAPVLDLRDLDRDYDSRAVALGDHPTTTTTTLLRGTGLRGICLASRGTADRDRQHPPDVRRPVAGLLPGRRDGVHIREQVVEEHHAGLPEGGDLTCCG